MKMPPSGQVRAKQRLLRKLWIRPNPFKNQYDVMNFVFRKKFEPARSNVGIKV